MPIYAYRCESCGHAKDVLQKVSDTPLSVCPQCGEASFRKQVTAAGFQLKGSGWYVTDFRNNNSGAPAPASKDGAEAPAGGAKDAEGAKNAASTKSAEPPAKSEAAPPAPAPVSSSPPPASGST